MLDITELEDLYRDISKGRASGTYPGEWIEQNLLSENNPDKKPDIEDVKSVAYLAAENVEEWDEGSKAYNAEQRLGMLRLFEKYASESPLIADSLKVLYTHDKECGKPLMDTEKDEAKIKEYSTFAKKAVDVKEMVRIMEIDEGLVDFYKKPVSEWAQKADPFEDEETLLFIARVNGMVKTKNRFLNALSRLMTENATKSSSIYKTLSGYYTERQIRFLNWKWASYYLGMGKTKDNILLEFFETIIFGSDKTPLQECEKTLLRCSVNIELSRKIEDESELYYVLCNRYRDMEYPKTLPNDDDWVFMTEIFDDYLNVNSYRSEYRSIRHTSFLDFYPLKEGAEKRLKAIHPSIACNILNEYFGSRRKNGMEYSVVNTKIVLPPEGEEINFSEGFSEKDMEDAKRLKNVCVEVFGENYIETLDKYACFGVITFLVRTGVEKEPETVTRWIQNIGGQFGDVCNIHLYEKTGELPKWELDSLNYSSYSGRGIDNNRIGFMESLKKDATEGLTKEQKREFMALILETAYRYYPSDYIDVLLTMFRSDDSYTNENARTNPFLLSDYFTDEEIRETGQALKGTVSDEDYEHYVMPHLISREEYEILKNKEKEELKKKAEEEERERDRKKTEEALKGCEEVHYTTRCLWRLQDIKDEELKHSIQNRVADNIINDFKKDGDVHNYLLEMSKVYSFPEDILLKITNALSDSLTEKIEKKKGAVI